ncbi:hypothetical protein Micbo1qcDRAFT_218940 [Microdochium bolleyi]|uniref:Uncharacterized protein n=1 Tax=Microdochium bolleyi TaxID=196109 RepID=A0A136IPB6_9PEZI|nr:hypothetical protein Micbo1qcDRAFT_218940 [Microdochium bolleyi]
MPKKASYVKRPPIVHITTISPGLEELDASKQQPHAAVALDCTVTVLAKHMFRPHLHQMARGEMKTLDPNKESCSRAGRDCYQCRTESWHAPQFPRMAAKISAPPPPSRCRPAAGHACRIPPEGSSGEGYAGPAKATRETASEPRRTIGAGAGSILNNSPDRWPARLFYVSC